MHHAIKESKCRQDAGSCITTLCGKENARDKEPNAQERCAAGSGSAAEGRQNGGKRGGRECNESGGTIRQKTCRRWCAVRMTGKRREGARRTRGGGGKEARAESEHFTWRCVVGLGLVEVHRGGRCRRDTSNNRWNHRLLTPGTARGDELTEQLHATGLHTRRVECTAGNIGPLGVRVNA
jgi:hypothetical protein